MAAYNHSRYNLGKFNIHETDSGNVKITLESKINCTISVGEKAYFTARIDSVIDGGMVTVGSGKFYSLTIQNRIECPPIPIANQQKVLLFNRIDGNLDLGSHRNAVCSFEALLENASDLGADSVTPVLLQNIVQSDLTLGANYWASKDLMAHIDGLIDIEVNSNYICIISTLPSGKILVVDADNYNVTLDGQNAIWIQSGDWLDEIKRNTKLFEISGSGLNSDSQLEISLYYMDRYL